MMNLGIAGSGKCTITDDNKTLVSEDLAKQIQEETQIKPDGKDNWTQPDLTVIKD